MQMNLRKIQNGTGSGETVKPFNHQFDNRSKSGELLPENNRPSAAKIN